MGYVQTPLSAGKWTHVAITYDRLGLNKESFLYVDGVQQGFQENSNDGSWNTQRDCVKLGGRCDNTLAFEGCMDEIRFYNATLTQAQILQDLTQTTGFHPSLVSRYDGSVLNGKLRDLVSNNHGVFSSVGVEIVAGNTCPARTFVTGVVAQVDETDAVSGSDSNEDRMTGLEVALAAIVAVLAFFVIVLIVAFVLYARRNGRSLSFS